MCREKIVIAVSFLSYQEWCNFFRLECKSATFRPAKEISMYKKNDLDEISMLGKKGKLEMEVFVY